MSQLFEQGLAAHRAGRLDQAEKLYRDVLRADPGSFAALHMLGFLKAQQGRYDDAIVLLKKAVRKNPADTAALAHYGHALMAAQRMGEALRVYDGLLVLEPRHFEAHYNRGVILSGEGKHQQALAALDQALAAQPNAAAVHFNRGVVLTALERHREALESYDRALALDPHYAPALANCAMAILNLCDWDRVAELPVQQAATQVTPLTFLGLSDNKGLQRACAEAAVRMAVPIPVPPMAPRERYVHDRIRLAYVSSDFREHAVAFQLAPLIEGHDRARFQVIGISTGPSDDSLIRARLTKAFDRFHDFSPLNSEDIARRLREMEIDIAVDLGGHTGLSRLQIFSHRPAPHQVSWLGYPGTTGAPFMDYLIADPVVSPAEDQPFYSEKLVQLPDTYFPTDAGRPIGITPTRADQGLPNEGFVFCCFNNGWKIARPVFDIWMRLLAEVPGSVLWLRRQPADTRANLEKEAAGHGINAGRLVFADDAPLDAHLARHRLADLFLDTLPYNAHATAADALSAGLPVLTCKGNAFAGRVAASLVGAVGLSALATGSLADYEALALALARDPMRLQALKDRLARNLPTAPLFDADRFRRAIEAAYVGMLGSARQP